MYIVKYIHIILYIYNTLMDVTKKLLYYTYTSAVDIIYDMIKYIILIIIYYININNYIIKYINKERPY